MPPVYYKVHDWGGPIGRGVMQSRHVHVAGVAKCASPDNPHAVANEVLCGALGRALCLPVPPSFLVEREGTTYHVSLNFHLAGESLPPADPSALATHSQELACGIVLFDMWVLNSDRHRNNLAFDQSTNQANLFDHSHAFYRGQGGTAFLDGQRDSLGIGGHCLVPHVIDAQAFSVWSDRLAVVPDFWILEALESAASAGLPREDLTFCYDFLRSRRDRARSILQANLSRFPNLQGTLMDAASTGATP